MAPNVPTRLDDLMRNFNSNSDQNTHESKNSSKKTSAQIL